jgi:L-ascorbate metabolism protein UlaG (beta-lactamase superfamily)
MKIRWFGQSAFLISDGKTVAIDPFGPIGDQLAERGIVFAYPPIDGVEADLLLITHDHLDHNAAEVVGGSPIVLSSPGTHESPVGTVVGVASEHDDVAGSARGANTIFRFALDGVGFSHLGDLGQASLRPEQVQAIGDVDVLFVPAGGGPTVGGESAAEVVRALRPRLVVPMHYRTEAATFLEPPDAFLDALGARVERMPESELEVEPLLGAREEPVVALLAPPVSATVGR